MSLPNSVTLNCGQRMPLLGLGTYKMKEPSDLVNALDCALLHGYRLIDTAAVYRNESIIGECLPMLLEKHGLKREDVFITTKLDPKYMDGSTIREAVESSLKNLKINYVDLYLIHWPAKQGLKHHDSRHPIYRKECWKILEDLVGTESIRAIGVSNYTPRHLQELLSYCRVIPAVLQSELHPDCVQEEAIEICRRHGIHFQAYSSLGAGKLVADERFADIATEHGKSIPQVLLRWVIERKCSVLPKSTNPKRIVENCGIFDFSLTADNTKTIFDRGGATKYCWDPDPVA